MITLEKAIKALRTTKKKQTRVYLKTKYSGKYCALGAILEENGIEVREDQCITTYKQYDSFSNTDKKLIELIPPLNDELSLTYTQIADLLENRSYEEISSLLE